VSGPIARAAGVDFDLRRDEPYLAYGELDTKVVTRTEGDCLARFECLLDQVYVSLDLADQCLRRLAELPPDVRAVIGHQPEQFASAAAHAEVVLHCSGGRPLLEALWPRLPRVRWVHSRSAGIDHILFPALVASPVILTNARGVFSRALAEFVTGAVLFFAKDFRRLLRSQAAGRWEPYEPLPVAGRTLGIVGYGDIGRAVAGHARGLGMTVVALRRRPGAGPDGVADEVVGPGALHQLMGRSEYVVVAAPLTPDTRGLVGRAALAAMKREGVLINVGRGPVIDEAALVDALEQGRLRGAALDVYEKEPLPAGHPLYRFDNVLLSPHCADNTAGWREEAMGVFLENLERFRRAQPLRNHVDKTLGY
jgi:phosphoglycerate dehydrogenase-like enzyme